jgi:predicted secreted protein
VNLTSMLAIYLLFWVLAAFFVMPFGLRTHDDAKADLVQGQVSSAPVNFNPKRIAFRATILSVLMFGLYYANYVNGWLTVDDIDVTQWFGSSQR